MNKALKLIFYMIFRNKPAVWLWWWWFWQRKRSKSRLTFCCLAHAEKIEFIFMLLHVNYTILEPIRRNRFHSSFKLNQCDLLTCKTYMCNVLQDHQDERNIELTEIFHFWTVFFSLFFCYTVVCLQYFIKIFWYIE